jgi:hypothetical protein
MNLEKYLVIAGAPGVYKLVATRKDGLIIEDKLEGRNRFVPNRGQQVTPLATIAMYTYNDAEGENTLPINDVFKRMLDQHEAQPTPSAKASGEELKAYFESVFPEYDRDRVHLNDMKKCLKWYNFMKEKGLLDEAIRESEEKDALTEEAGIELPPHETPAEKADTEAPEKDA